MAQPESVSGEKIVEGMSFRDILSLVNGVQEIERDGKKYISLVHGLRIIKEAIDSGLIPSGKLKVIIAALHNAAGSDIFYESPEQVGELVRGFNDFDDGFRIGQRSGMRTTGRLFAPFLKNK